MGRQRPKEHGHPDDRFFVGAPDGKILLIEDVATTGISMINFINRLYEANKTIVAAISLTNRMDTNHDNKTVSDLMKELGIPYYSLSNGKELLQTLIEKKELSSELQTSLQNEINA